MRKNLFSISICLCVLLLFGCMRSTELCYPEPQGKLLIEGDKIYLNNELYAELRYRSTCFDNNLITKLVIYYHLNDREEWIFPSVGESYYVVVEKKKYSTLAEMEQLEKEAKQKGYTLHSNVTGLDHLDTRKVYLMIGHNKFEPVEKSPSPLACNIRFSEDGRYVLYEFMYGKKGTQKYPVKYGECFERDSGAPRRR